MVLVDRSAEHLSALNPAFQRHHNVLVLIGWALLAGLVRVVRVVMLGVLLQDRSKVAFVVDQHPVSAFGSDGAHPVLGVAIGRGVRGGVFITVTPSPAKTSSKTAVNLASRSRMRNRNDVHAPCFHFHHEQHVQPVQAFQEDRVDVEEVAGEQPFRLQA
jgi:hypothetical protein